MGTAYPLWWSAINATLSAVLAHVLICDTAPSSGVPQIGIPSTNFTASPCAELIRAVVEMKQRNPNWGCPRIAQQMALAFHIQIDKDVVRRILAVTTGRDRILVAPPG